MKIYYHTFKNHLVSGKELTNLTKAWESAGIEIVKNAEDADAIVVKAFSAPYENFIKFDKPIILQSFGVNYGSHIDPQKENAVLDELYKKADGVVYMSEFSKRLTRHYYGNMNRAEEVIFNSQEVVLNYEPPKIGNLSIQGASTSIWRDWKRLNDLVWLTRRWNEKHEKKHRLELFIAGKGDDLDDKNIHFLGHKKEFEHYKKMHFYLYPALMETFGNSVAEALAYGLPCMVTNFGATSELVGDAGVVLCNDPEEYLNFSERPVMYGKVKKVDQELFEVGLIDLIDNYDDYRAKARERAEVFRHKVIGEKWYNYLRKFV